MKNILILFCLCAMAWACSKKWEDVVPVVDIAGGSEDIYEQAKKMAKDSAGLNITGLVVKSVNDSIVFFSGIKYGKFWIGKFPIKPIYDSNEQVQSIHVDHEIASYTFKFDYQFEREIHVGYGEYKKIDISLCNFYLCGEDEFPLNFEISIAGMERNSHDSQIVYDFLIVNNDSEKLYPNTFHDKKTEWFNGTSLFFTDNWNNAYTPGGNIYSSVYSSDGERLFIANYGSDGMTPISMEEGVGVLVNGRNIHIRRTNIKTGENIYGTSWLLDIPDNSKISTRKIKEENNEWYYESDITHYDGSKDVINFKVDIETGYVTEI